MPDRTSKELFCAKFSHSDLYQDLYVTQCSTPDVDWDAEWAPLHVFKMEISFMRDIYPTSMQFGLIFLLGSFLFDCCLLPTKLILWLTEGQWPTG